MVFQHSLLEEVDVERVADGVLTTLEKVGMYCQNRELLQALEGFGARVDYEEETARFPASLTEEFIGKVRQESSPSPTAAPKIGHVSMPCVEMQVAQFCLDYRTGELTPGGSQDFIKLVQLGNVLHPEAGVGHALLIRDVPPILEPLEAAMLLAEYADIPHPVFAWNVRQSDYLIEMGEILGIKDWFSFGANCFAHPLRFDRDVADRFVRRVKVGEAAGFTAMPVAGMTTPVTAAGFMVVSSAELVATWLAGRALNPHVELAGSIWGATVDMKTGQVSYNAFDAMIFAFATSEFLRQWTGKALPVGGGEYCDARVPGYYAALEKAYKALLIAAFSGHHPSIGQGLLDKGRIFCPVQLLLERDFTSGVQMLGQPIAVNEETLSLESILEVQFGVTTNHLATDHTLRHYRDALWCPRWMERTPWEGEKVEKRVLDRLDVKARELIANYQKPKRDPDILAKMRAVVERARRDLLRRPEGRNQI